MYLKSLDIQGFKSFPDKIELEFGHGITSIVGPNGSGKSNISDAVRWVLGEQSVKVLRGSKMEDVIFAGTETRKHLGFAEVSLVIDNYGNILPVDFSEVTITRRVYRSGESEYYINKSSCRLKDIHQLFMDTGMGKDGYSIIGQGRIDEILSTKSEDRRQVFEEAAGITKYKYRRHESEKKLELTRQNLLRVNDIINELQLQIEPLKEQSDKAKTFLNLREELKSIEINLSLHNIEKLRNNLSEIQGDFKDLSEQQIDEQKNLDIMEGDTESLQNSIRTRDDSLEKVRDDLRKTESLCHDFKRESELLKNDIKNNEVQIEKITVEIKELEEKILIYDENLKDKAEQIEASTIEKSKANEDVLKLEEKNEELNVLIDTVNDSIEALKGDAIEKMNQTTEIKGKINSYQIMEGNFKTRKGNIDKELEQIDEGIKLIEELLEKLQKDYLDGKKEISEIQSRINKVQNEYEIEKGSLTQLKEKHNEIVRNIDRDESKLRMLSEMEKDFEGYYKSVKNILIESQNGVLKHLAIHGALSQLISVPDKYVSAVETALGSAMQNIVVDCEQDAKHAIKYLKERNLGRATFLPISSVVGKLIKSNDGIEKCQGYLGVASDIIEYNKKYEGIVNSLLGRTIVVENIDNGIMMAKKYNYSFRIVTLDGELLNPGGSIAGGSINKSSGFLSRANQIKTLTDEIKVLERKASNIEDTIDDKHMEINKITLKIKQEEDLQKEVEKNCVKMEAEIMHSKSSIISTSTKKKELMNEREQIDEQLKNTDIEVENLSLVLEELGKSVLDIEQLVKTRQEAYENEKSQKETIGKELFERKMHFKSLEKDIEVLNDALRSINHEKNSLRDNINRKSSERVKLLNINDETLANIQEKSNIIKKYEYEIENVNSRISQDLKMKSDAQNTIDKLQKDIKQKRETISVLKEQLYKIENKKTKMETELESIINRLWDDYEVSYTIALEYKQDIVSFSATNKRILELKEQIKSLGTVNINAIEEYKMIKERYEFLTNQKNDMEDAEKSLVKIIQDIVKLMNIQFMTQFKIINENFNIVFSELFGGGRAEIKLTDPENILESGIDIEVQPPGKKLQNLMLLSGGEKAFTAIALLFAILRVRPTPFCILDEIDAALDDSNVYRFAQYLREFSENTQFILVTHRRGTMELSDILYGVTMQENGVSKLLPLNISDVAS